MIKFGKLRWKNLLSTGNVFTEVDLSFRGTTLIVGANGSGKSTMIEAFSFAMYGKSFRRVNKSQLLNSINKKEMLCEVEFSVGDSEYLVRRGMKPNVFEVHRDGVSLDQHGSSSDLQDYLERYILRMNFRACMQVVVLGSASYVPFMELPAQHRREVLEDVLDIRVLGVMASVLKSRAEATESKIVGANAGVSIAADRVKVARATETSLSEDRAERVKRLEARRALVSDKLAEAAERGIRILDEVKKTTGEAGEDRRQEVETLKTKIAGWKVMLKNSEERLKFFDDNDVCPVCDTVMTDEHRKTEKGAALEEVEKYEAAIIDAAGALDAVTQYQSEREVTLRKINILESEKAILKNVIRAHHSEIESIDVEIADANKPRSVDSVEDMMKLEDDLEEAQKVLSRYAEERDVQRDVASVLRDDGVKAAIVKRYVPVLNQLVNKYLAALDFYVNFEFDESFNEKILSRHRDEFTYNSFSEGEKTRINLAILFTWREIAKLRNSASTNVVIMDEVFDSSLDGAGAEDFTAMLQKMVGDTNVVIISHRTDQLTDKFDRVIKFSKTKNFSGMEQ